MDLKTVKKYFHDEDLMCGLIGKHPMKPIMERCGGTAYVKRFKTGEKEIIFFCNRFHNIHIVRDCSDNCSHYALCKQVDRVRQAEAMLEIHS